MHAKACLRVLTVLFIAGSADADVLQLVGGGQVRGTVKEVLLRAGRTPTIYPRTSILSLTITSPPEAKAALYGDREVEGEVVSVRMLTLEGVRTVSGSKIKALELTKDGLVPEQEESSKPRKDEPEDDEKRPDGISDEQQKLLETNKALWKEHYDKLEGMEDEEKAALKAEYTPKCDKVVETAKKVNKTIQDKLRKREEEDRRYREELRRYNNDRRRDGNNNNRNRYRAPTKPRHNDGLENDQRELEYIRSAGIKLKRIIAGKTDDIERNTSRRVDRLRSVHGWYRKKILAGETPDEKEMRAKYEAAFVLDEKE